MLDEQMRELDACEARSAQDACTYHDVSSLSHDALRWDQDKARPSKVTKCRRLPSQPVRPEALLLPWAPERDDMDSILPEPGMLAAGLGHSKEKI